MVKLIRQGVYFMDGKLVKESEAFMTSEKKEAAMERTISYRLLSAHNLGDDFELKLKFDLFAAADASYVPVLRTADDAGLREFPAPFVLFDCGDEKGSRAFGISAAKKFGGEFVAAGTANASTYLSERRAKSGDLILGTELLSCGAVGAMAFSDDNGALLRSLFRAPYDLSRPQTVAVYLKGKLRKGVGSTDVALEILKAAGDFATDTVFEAIGPGVGDLSMEQRMGIDEFFTAAGCLASVWTTDDKTQAYFEQCGRGEDFKQLSPAGPAYYDMGIVVDLSRVEPMCMIGENIRPVKEVIEQCDVPEQFLKNGKVFLPSAVVTSYAASYEKIADMAEILRGKRLSPETACYLFFPSRAAYAALEENGYLRPLIEAGVHFEEWVPESARVFDGYGWDERGSFEIFDAHTLAATMSNGGYLTSALDREILRRFKKPRYDVSVYESRVIGAVGFPQHDLALAYGEDIKPIPALAPLPNDLRLSLNGEDPSAILLSDAEEYEWAQAIDDRERGVRAVLAKAFPAKLRTHLIDWGLLPLTYDKFAFKEGDVICLDHIAGFVTGGEEKLIGKVVGKRRTKDIVLSLGALSDEEKKILLAGGKNNILRG